MLVVLSVAVSGVRAQGDRLKTSGDHAAMRTLEDGTRLTELTGNASLVGQGLDLSGDIGRLFFDLDEAEVVGNVHLVTDSLELWCDSLRVWQLRNEGRAFGQVRIETADGVRGFGHRAIYLRDQDWLALIGNARVLQADQVVAGDSVTIDRRKGQLESFGNVIVIDTANDATVHGEHAIFDQETGLGIVDSVPVLRMREGDGPMTRVDAELMVFDRESETQTAIGNVDFRQGLSRAHADTARIVGRNLLVLTGSPTMEQEGRIMQGREIRIWSVEGKVDHIEVYDEATLTDSTPDTLAMEFSGIPLANTLSGDTLEIDFDEGLIQSTRVRGNAHSVYLPEDQESVVSVNDVRGETIDIRFEDGRVDVVDVRGSVEGSYLFYERRFEAPVDSATADSLATAAELAELTELAAQAELADRPDSLTATPGHSLATGSPDSLALASTDSLPRGDLVDFRSTAQAVQYSGDQTHFDIPGRRIDISGDSRVQHGTLILIADEVRFDTERRELLAEDDNVVRLIDTDTELIGARMGYLFDPQTGAVADGATRYSDGFYEGAEIRRIDKSTMLIEHGTFTSCDLADPHYHFNARKMKLKVGENVVARQISMHISNIPVMVLPFYYKELKRGRRSGILFPNVNIGVSSRDGRYVRDMGYYWATNEYTDFKFEMDYTERREATFKIENVYVKRYSFDGRARFEYLRKFSEDTEGDEWKFTSEHRQPELWEDWRASAKIEVSSKNVTRTNLSTNHNRDLIDGQLYSTASMSRSFDSGASVNFSFTRRQFPNADDGDPIDDARISEFNVPLALSFKSGPVIGGTKRPGNNLAANFLRDFTWSQGYSARYDQQRREAFESDAASGNLRYGLNWAPDKVGPLRISSGATFTDNWVYTNSEKLGYIKFTAPDSSVIDETIRDPSQDEVVDGSDNRMALNISNVASTDVYGFFAPHIGALRGIKHKMIAAVSWNLRPG
ncbi:hypothetical protein DRQ32_10240, partial [bacterium]